MKQVSVGLLLLALVFVTAAPAVYARGGDDDGDRTELRSNDDSEDSDDGLEVEADVFTDTTIVKVELASGTKSVFETDADTEEEVVAVVADKFGLTEAEVATVIDFEIEDRASRSFERAKGKDRMKDKVKDRLKDRYKVCRDDASTGLEVEADVFTDTTIVKVELASGTKSVFETDATTSSAVVAEVADRYDLDADDVEAVIDFEVEDRAARAADRAIASNTADCDDSRAQVGDGKHGTSTPGVRDAELKARIAELQRLLDTFIKLFTARFGTSI